MKTASPGRKPRRCEIGVPRHLTTDATKGIQRALVPKVPFGSSRSPRSVAGAAPYVRRMATAGTVRQGHATKVVEVWADVACPFTHVGLRRFVQARAEAGRGDVRLWVRPWPLEIVNREPLDPGFIAEEVAELRKHLVPGMFRGFTEAAFPATSVPALALAARGYAHGFDVGEAISLELRHLLFEEGVDVSQAAVLDQVAARHELTRTRETALVTSEYANGVQRGVVGSPHFFTAVGDFFCPALDISRDRGGHLYVRADPDRFARFLDACFG